MCPQSSLRFVFCLRHTVVAGSRGDDLVLRQELQCSMCALKSFQAMAVTVAQSLCVFVPHSFLGLATVLPSLCVPHFRPGTDFPGLCMLVPHSLLGRATVLPTLFVSHIPFGRATVFPSLFVSHIPLGRTTVLPSLFVSHVPFGRATVLPSVCVLVLTNAGAARSVRSCESGLPMVGQRGSGSLTRLTIEALVVPYQAIQQIATYFTLNAFHFGNGLFEETCTRISTWNT